MFDFDKWRQWLVSRTNELRGEGLNVEFVDSLPKALLSPKSSYCFQFSTIQKLGQMSVWSSGECDFDIVDTQTLEVAPNLFGFQVDNENFEATFDKFCLLVSGG